MSVGEIQSRNNNYRQLQNNSVASSEASSSSSGNNEPDQREIDLVESLTAANYLVYLADFGQFEDKQFVRKLRRLYAKQADPVLKQCLRNQAAFLILEWVVSSLRHDRSAFTSQLKSPDFYDFFRFNLVEAVRMARYSHYQ